MNRRAFVLSGLMAAGFAAAFPHPASAAPEKTAAAAPLEVTYYYLPT
jgi:hypothetical protein